MIGDDKVIENNFINCFEFLKRTLITNHLENETILAICEYMVSGNLVIQWGQFQTEFTYEEKLKFNSKKIDWDLEYENNEIRPGFYLHSLEPVKYLLQGYTLYKQKSYLNLALEITIDWIGYLENHAENEFSWYRHCVSDRILYLVFLIENLKRNTEFSNETELKEIHSVLKKHADYLYDDENYITQNHGMMMDRSLYFLSKYLYNRENNEVIDKWTGKAIKRLRNSVKTDFTENMVNLENSSGYLLFIMDLLINTEKNLLNLFGDSIFDGDFKDRMSKGIEYLAQLTKPDSYLPIIGDGEKISFLDIDKYSFFNHISDNEILEYILTSGKKGAKPQETFKVYECEGYAFMRTTWDYEEPSATYASFISGYQLKNHKHGDDLSFTYYAKGKDIFVDSGTFTYKAGDFRRYFMGAPAHNTVIVDGKTYPFILGNPSDTGILEYGEEEDYFYVIGKNDMYRGVNITRSLYFLKSGNIVIIDDIASYEEHTYSQHFHLNHDFRNAEIKIDETNGSLQVLHDNTEVNLVQVLSGKWLVHKGDRNKAGLGLISEGFNSLEETVTLECQIRGKSGQFITLISTENADSKAVLEANKSEKVLEVIDDKRSFSIDLNTPSRDLGITLVVRKNNEKQYDFEIVGTVVPSEYAFYIMLDNQKIDEIWYSEETTLSYIFERSGTYEIKYFIREKDDLSKKEMYIHRDKIIIG